MGYKAICYFQLHCNIQSKIKLACHTNKNKSKRCKDMIEYCSLILQHALLDALNPLGNSYDDEEEDIGLKQGRETIVSEREE